MALPGIITLTTDFGINDGYIASVKGAILNINPDAKIVDVCHTIRPQNILQASYILNTAYPYYPEGSIHVVVIDPGVGSSRRAIIVKTPLYYFIAPDNGVLSCPLNGLLNKSPRAVIGVGKVINKKKLPSEIHAVSISNRRYWNRKLSPVFHGRDIFAPIAAHLSHGTSIENFGKDIKYINILGDLTAYINAAGDIVGKVIHIDYFGNIITNIKVSGIAPGRRIISIAGQRIAGINRYYAEKPGLLAIEGSSGHLEISIGDGNASHELGINIGDRVTVSTK